MSSSKKDLLIAAAAATVLSMGLASSRALAQTTTGGATSGLNSVLVDPANGHAYEIVTGATSWSQAESAAASRGGYLVTITSSQEQSFVTSAMSGSGANTGSYWIGLTNTTTTTSGSGSGSSSGSGTGTGTTGSSTGGLGTGNTTTTGSGTGNSTTGAAGSGAGTTAGGGVNTGPVIGPVSGAAGGSSSTSSGSSGSTSSAASAFHWVTNEAISYTNWEPGQPDNMNGNEDAGAILWDKTQGGDGFPYSGAWDDLPGAGVPSALAPNPGAAYLETAGYVMEWSSAQAAGVGSSTGSGGGASAVPLPAAALMFLPGAAVAGIAGRRLRRRAVA